VHVRVTSIATGASLNTRPDVPTRGRQNTATTAPHGTQSLSPSITVHLVCARFRCAVGAAAWLGREALVAGQEVVQALLCRVPAAGPGAGEDRVEEGGGLGVRCVEGYRQPDVYCGAGVGACPRGCGGGSAVGEAGARGG